MLNSLGGLVNISFRSIVHLCIQTPIVNVILVPGQWIDSSQTSKGVGLRFVVPSIRIGQERNSRWRISEIWVMNNFFWLLIREGWGFSIIVMNYRFKIRRLITQVTLRGRVGIPEIFETNVVQIQANSHDVLDDEIALATQRIAPRCCRTAQKTPPDCADEGCWWKTAPLFWQIAQSNNSQKCAAFESCAFIHIPPNSPQISMVLARPLRRFASKSKCRI